MLSLISFQKFQNDHFAPFKPIFPNSLILTQTAEFSYTENKFNFHKSFQIPITHNLSIIFINFISKDSLLLCQNGIMQK